MFYAIGAVFVLVFAVDMGTAYVVVTRPMLGSWWRIAYSAAVLAAGVVAALTSFQYEYFPNANTRICGWPVPTVIFQRENADAHWDDFVGPLTVLSYPLNLAIFLSLPSVAFLAFALKQTRSKLPT
jgi:hypothetical protein